VKEFQAKQYTAAASSLRRANDIAPTSAHAFNLGTAQIAAGRREEGSATLARAMSDPKLRADALYNRGTSALVAGAYDYAIRDLTESLRIRANHLPSKRNLEIALAKKREQQKQRGGNQQSPSGGKQPDKKQPTPAPGEDRKEKGDPTVEALLRSVQQQEQEELRRMHRASPEKLHVGW
jgi:tetratricopeptide (TPR) repeat protein